MCRFYLSHNDTIETIDSRLPSLRSTPYRSSPEPFYVDKAGEMPAGAVLSRSTPVSRSASRPGSVISRTASPAPMRVSSGLASSVSSFPQYEVVDDQPSTPEPVKVQSKKKKAAGTGTGKKKRTKPTVLDS